MATKKNVPLSFRPTEDVAEALRKAAEDRGCSITDIIEEALSTYLPEISERLAEEHRMYADDYEARARHIRKRGGISGRGKSG